MFAGAAEHDHDQMSSSAGAPETPPTGSSTEFVRSASDTSVHENAVEELTAHITEIVADSRTRAANRPRSRFAVPRARRCFGYQRAHMVILIQ